MKNKATTLIFKSNDVFQRAYPIPWLVYKKLRFDWYPKYAQLWNINT